MLASAQQLNDVRTLHLTLIGTDLPPSLWPQSGCSSSGHHTTTFKGKQGAAQGTFSSTKFLL